MTFSPGEFVMIHTVRKQGQLPGRLLLRSQTPTSKAGTAARHSQMELAGLALTTIALGDPIITAIRDLRKPCNAVNEVPGLLDRLEQEGSIVCLYLGYVDEAIIQNPYKYPDIFIHWFEEEKKLLGRSTRQIKSTPKRFNNTCNPSRLWAAWAMCSM